MLGLDRHHTLSILTRIIARNRNKAHWLEDGLERDFEQLAECAIDVAVENRGPIGETLASKIEHGAGSPELIARLFEHCHQGLRVDSYALRDVHLALTDRILRRAQQKRAQIGPLWQSFLAETQLRRAQCLAALERQDEALEAAQQTVTIYRELAASDLPTYRSELAAAVSCLGLRCFAIGRLGEAVSRHLEAVSLLRSAPLEASASDVGIELAHELTNLAITQEACGHPAEALESAQEALELYRQAGLRGARSHADRAGGLNNLSLILNRLGRHREAAEALEKAVTIFEQLAADQPDTFRPRLALMLGNLGNQLGRLDRLEDALTASQLSVQMFRKLALERPDDFEAEYGRALIGWVTQLYAADRYHEAIEPARDAVAIFERLMRRHPEAYRVALAFAAEYLSLVLRGADFMVEAAQSMQHSIELWQALTASHPTAHRHDFAQGLVLFARSLNDTGDPKQALEVCDQAIDVFQNLERLEPTEAAAGLMRAGVQRTTLLQRLGRVREAIEAAQEALTLARQVRQKEPAAYGDDLALALRGVGAVLMDVGELEQAWLAFSEAVDVRRESPQGSRMRLASDLNNCVAILLELKRPRRAQIFTQECLELWQDLEPLHPHSANHGRATTMTHLATACRLQGDLEAALTADRTAVEIFRRLKSDQAGQLHLASGLCNLALDFSKLDRAPEAQAAYVESLELLRVEATNQRECRLELVKVMENLAEFHFKLGQLNEAWPLFEEAAELRLSLAEDRGAELHGPYAILGFERLVDIFDLLQQPEQAIQNLARRAEALGRLARDAPSSFAEALASALDGLTYRLYHEEAWDQACQVSSEALACWRECFGFGLIETCDHLIEALIQDGAIRSAAGRFEEACEPLEEALELTETTEISDINMHSFRLRALTNLTSVLSALGRDYQAIHFYDMALATLPKLNDMGTETEGLPEWQAILEHGRQESVELMTTQKMALTQLDHLANRKSSAIRFLEGALAGRLEALVEVACEVSAETGGPMAKVLSPMIDGQANAALAKRSWPVTRSP